MIEVRVAKPEDILALRQKVLRPNHAIVHCVFSCDHEVHARHFSAFHKGKQIGVASISQDNLKKVPGEHDLSLFEDKVAWRIRGMAVLPEYHKQGVGQQLMLILKDYVWNRPNANNHFIWCNARVIALRFYQRQGFKLLGEEFELPEVGPHFVMYALS